MLYPLCIPVFVVLCDCLTSNVAILNKRLLVPLEINILSSQSPVYSYSPSLEPSLAEAIWSPCYSHRYSRSPRTHARPHSS